MGWEGRADNGWWVLAGTSAAPGCDPHFPNVGAPRVAVADAPCAPRPLLRLGEFEAIYYMLQI